MLTLPGCSLSLDTTLWPPLPLVERLVHYMVGAVKWDCSIRRWQAVHTLPLTLLRKTVPLGT